MVHAPIKIETETGSEAMWRTGCGWFLGGLVKTWTKKGYVGGLGWGGFIRAGGLF